MFKNPLSHLNDSGQARMVDVSSKEISHRTAVARGEVIMKMETYRLIHDDTLEKGDILTVAQVAGISAAKRTSDLIPLCHPLVLTHIDVQLSLKEELPGIEITAAVQSTGKTGVEMEALTAVAVSALTVYDMAKSVEKTIRIEAIRLIEKRGGSSGDVMNDETKD